MTDTQADVLHKLFAKMYHRAKTRSHNVAKTLPKQPCEVCGSLKSQAHHENYLEPSVVRWLCVSHHRARHRELGWGIRKLGPSKSFCKHGHALTGDNIYHRYYDGGRACGMCIKLATARYHAKKRLNKKRGIVMQIQQLKVTGIEQIEDGKYVKLKLEGKGVSTPYTTMVLVVMSADEARGVGFGDSFTVNQTSLTYEPQLVKTAPLSGRYPNDYFADGSPVPEDSECQSHEDEPQTAQDREQPGYHPPAPPGIPGDSLASGAAGEIERKGGYQP